MQNKSTVGKVNQPNINQGNVSNIAKILLQAGKTKTIIDNKNNQSANKINTNFQSINVKPRKTDILADIVNQKLRK